MNRIQKLILIYGLILFVLFSAFPPWIYTLYITGTRDYSGIRSEKSAGYHFILSPPAPEKDAPAFGVKLDVSRLGLELISVAAITAAAFFASQLGEKKSLVKIQSKLI